MRYLNNRFIGAIVLFVLTALLAGCFMPATAPSTGSSTPVAATVIAGEATPTPVPSGNPQPTSQPTLAPSTGNQQPTSVPAAKPTIDFQPRGGVAGTTVAVRGWGFAPNSRIAIRIGLPQAVGEVLATLQTDPAGAGTAQVIIPGVLPSGEPITTNNMRIVAMDEQNQSLASAPFAFEAGVPPMDAQPVYGFANSAEEATKYLLDALLHYPNGREAFAYLSPKLFQKYSQGPATNILQLQNPFQSYAIDGVVASGGTGGSMTVQATLDSITKMQFVAIPDQGGGLWVVDEVLNIPPSNTGNSGSTTQPVKWFWPQEVSPELSVQPDGYGSYSSETLWVLHLAQPHATMPDVIISGAVGTDALGDKLQDVTVRGQPGIVFANGAGHAVFWSEGSQPYTVAGTRSLDELLQIANGLQEIDRATWQQRVRPQ